MLMHLSLPFSQLHSLVSFPLDHTFDWQSGLPGLMLRYALLSAPNGTMSRFTHLTTVNYDSNVSLSKEERP